MEQLHPLRSSGGGSEGKRVSHQSSRGQMRTGVASHAVVVLGQPETNGVVFLSGDGPCIECDSIQPWLRLGQRCESALHYYLGTNARFGRLRAKAQKYIQCRPCAK